jgi:uncharacterized coiled-coil protein SlyX
MSRLESYQQKIFDVEAAVSAKMNEYENLKIHNDNLLKNAQREIDIKSAQVLDQENKLHDLNNTIAQKDNLIEDKSLSINNKNEIIDKLTTTNRILNDSLHDVRTQNSVIKSELAKEKSKREKTELQAGEVMTTLENVKHAIEYLECHEKEPVSYTVMKDVITDDKLTKEDINLKIDFAYLKSQSEDFKASNFQVSKREKLRQQLLSDLPTTPNLSSSSPTPLKQ